MLAVSMSPPVVHGPAVQKRPKLSLKTSELPITYGASSRSLSTIATPSAAVTPTTFNTFNNTFDLTHRPSPTSTNGSPSITRSIPARDHHARSQSPRPKQNETTYIVNLPYGVKPILKNTPYPRLRNNSISASPRSSTRRVFFPAPKQVVFKTSIEEPIVTKVYTARHSDLFDHETESDTEILGNYVGGTVSDPTSESFEGTKSSLVSLKRRKHFRDSVESATTVSTEAATSSSPSSSLLDTTSVQPATPSSTRGRKTWEWTLGSLPPNSYTQPTTTKADSPAQPESISSHPSKLRLVSQSETESQPESSVPDTDRKSDRQEATPAQPHSQPQPPQPHSEAVTPESSTSTPPQSAHSPILALSSRRASSLDDTPQRKRKAECLEVVSTALIVTTTSKIDTETTVATDSEPSGLVGQTGSKGRERAATL